VLPPDSLDEVKIGHIRASGALFALDILRGQDRFFDRSDSTFD
jgi:hypothetical protein